MGGEQTLKVGPVNLKMSVEDIFGFIANRLRVLEEVRGRCAEDKEIFTPRSPKEAPKVSTDSLPKESPRVHGKGAWGKPKSAVRGVEMHENEFNSVRYSPPRYFMPTGYGMYNAPRTKYQYPANFKYAMPNMYAMPITAPKPFVNINSQSTSFGKGNTSFGNEKRYGKDTSMKRKAKKFWKRERGLGKR